MSTTYTSYSEAWAAFLSGPVGSTLEGATVVVPKAGS